MYSILFQSINPFFNFRFLRTHLMTIDAEAFLHIGAREGCFHVFHAIGQSAALMGGKGNDGLALQVVRVLLEEGKHHLRIGAPPDGTTDEHGVVGS